MIFERIARAFLGGANLSERHPAAKAYTHTLAPYPPTTAKRTNYKGLALRPPAPWGEDNLGPQTLNALVEQNPLLAAAVEFKASLLAGDGVIPVRRELQNGHWKYTPCYEYDEINQFLHDNDINGFLAEQAIDMIVLGNVFPEFVLNPDRTRVIQLNHLEGALSRLEQSAAGGRIFHHLYSHRWDQAPPEGFPEGMVATPLLPTRNAPQTLRYWMGLDQDPTGRHKPRPSYRYVLHQSIPVPGAGYYARPSWAALADSGWLHFASEIPKYKQATLDNSTIVRYMVRIHPNFWQRFYESIKAETPEDQTLARDRWLAKLNQFLSDPTNSGKAFISEMLQAGPQTINLIEIEPIKNQPTGGELLAEVEETSNIIAYGMGIHPSLIGASPGRSKTISGTEARELFIIKQALLAPVRERLLSPLRIVAAANSWPKDISFRISNLELTTLDRHTGAVRSIGQDAIENPT